MYKRIVVLLVLFTILFSTCIVYADTGEPGAIEKMVAGTLNNIANYLYDKFNAVHADIDTIVYNGEGSIFNVNFEKNTESPIGLMGITLYQITRTFAQMLMLVVLAAVLGKAQISSITKNKVSLIQTLGNFTLAFVLIVWTPMLINFLLKMSSLFVTAVNPVNMGGEGLTFIDSLKQTAVTQKTIMDAIVYAGSVIINLYYVFAYFTRGLHLALFVFLFPILAMYLNSPTMRKQFDTFISDIISTIAIQPFDALLLYGVGLVFRSELFSNNDMGFWKVILLASIIPMRGIAKNYLGFSKGSALGDMMGMTGAMAIFNLARGTARGIRNFSGGVTDGAGDLIRAEKYKNENGEVMDQTSATFGGNMGNAEQMKPLRVPDFTPWKGDGSIDVDRIGRMAKTPRNAYDQLRKQGFDKIARNTFEAGSGIVGAGIGGVMGLGLGASGVIAGAGIGSEIGSALGSGAYSLASPAAGLFGRYLAEAAKQRQQPETQQKTNIENMTDVGDTTINVPPMQQLNKSSMDMANFDPANAGAMNNSNSYGTSPAIRTEDQLNIEFNRQLSEMPVEVKEQIAKKATETAVKCMGRYDMLTKAEKSSFDKIRDLSVKAQAGNYAISKMVESGYIVDTADLKGLKADAMNNARNEIVRELNKYRNKNDDIDLQDIA